MQYKIAGVMPAEFVRRRNSDNPVRFVITTGDNIYASTRMGQLALWSGNEDRHWESKFFRPYERLLGAGAELRPASVIPNMQKAHIAGWAGKATFCWSKSGAKVCQSHRSPLRLLEFGTRMTSQCRCQSKYACLSQSLKIPSSD